MKKLKKVASILGLQAIYTIDYGIGCYDLGRGRQLFINLYAKEAWAICNFKVAFFDKSESVEVIVKKIKEII